MPNGDYGIAGGYNAAIEDSQRIQEGKQRISRGAQELQLGDVRNQEAGMELQDYSRQRSDRDATRQAVANAPDVDKALDAFAQARKAAGDMPGYASATDALTEFRKKSVLETAKAAQEGGDPKQIEETLRARGHGKDIAPDTLKFGTIPPPDPSHPVDPQVEQLLQANPGWQRGDHLIMYTNAQTGQPVMHNASATLRTLIPPVQTKLTPGETLVTGGVGRQPTTLTAPLQDKYISTRGGGSINQRTGEPGYIPPGPSQKEQPTKITTTQGGETFKTEGGKTYRLIQGTPGTPGKTHTFKPDEPATPGSQTHWEEIPEGAQPPAGQPSGEAPPVPGAKQGKSPDGTQGWFVPDPQRPGKFLQVQPAGGAQPAPKQPAPKQTQVKNDEDQIPQVAEPSTPSSPKQKFQSRVAATQAEQKTKQAAADQERKQAPKQKAADVFRDIAKSPRMSKDDIPLIKEGMDSGLLTSAEMTKGKKMLDALQPQQAAYKRGGKVQRYGLR